VATKKTRKTGKTRAISNRLARSNRGKGRKLKKVYVDEPSWHIVVAYKGGPGLIDDVCRRILKTESVGSGYDFLSKTRDISFQMPASFTREEIDQRVLLLRCVRAVKVRVTEPVESPS
jgi:hypothetical protein